MLSSESGNLIYNIVPKSANHSSKNIKATEFTNNYEENSPKKTATNFHKPPIYPASSKNITTTKDWFQRETLKKKKSKNLLVIDQTEPEKRVSVSERKSRRVENMSGMNFHQKLM